MIGAPEIPTERTATYSNQYLRYFRILSLLEHDSVAITLQSEERWRTEVKLIEQDIITGWQRGSEATAQFVLEKASLILQLLHLVRMKFPWEIDTVTSDERRPERLYLLTCYVKLLEQRDVVRSSRILWFAPIVKAVRSSEHDNEMDVAFLLSSDLTLRLYGRLFILLAERGKAYQ